MEHDKHKSKTKQTSSLKLKTIVNPNSNESYTSFLASKKLFRCLICQNPVMRRMIVWAMDHHRTRWLVLSLVCLNLSSRYWNNWENRRDRLNSMGVQCNRKVIEVKIWLSSFDIKMKGLMINIRFISNCLEIVPG